MSDNFKYPVKLTPDDNNTFYVTFPDFPEAITFGENVEDAIFHAQNALDEVMHFYMSEKKAIPIPSKKGEYFVYLRPLAAAKIMLYQEMIEGKFSKAELARKLDCNQKQVDRILDIKHNSTISQLSAACAALSKRLVIGMEDINTK